MEKPGAKSSVWEYFGLKRGRNRKPTGTNTAICPLCHKRVAVKNGNTSNLLACLRMYHLITNSKVNEAIKAKQPQRSSKSHHGVSVGQSTICAMSLPSEHLFSSSGHVVSPIRMKLNQTKLTCRHSFQKILTDYFVNSYMLTMNKCDYQRVR